MIRIVSVNVGHARRIRIDDRDVLTAIHKRAVPSVASVAVHPLGLAGDEQANLDVHGGPSKAVYAYPIEHYAFWAQARAQALGTDAAARSPMAPGAMGENLTLEGLLETDLWIGDVLQLPHCTLAVSEPRHPCFKFNATMGFAHASKAMMQQGCCGAYLSVADAGSLRAGDAVTLVPGPREARLLDVFLGRAR